MYRQVLVATDGGPGAERAVREAAGLASLSGAALHGLFVVDEGQYSAVPASRTSVMLNEVEAMGENALEAVRAAGEARGVTVVTAMRRGSPVDEILSYVEGEGADVVVMGTHGRSGVSRFLLGSVAESVIRRSPVPVHVVRVESD